MKAPLITVLLPVYNGGKDLKRAVLSILEQTYSKFELLIINDGSKDNSADILKSIIDPRIMLVHQENMGLAKTLNRGIALSRGQYIARHDQDDFSLPTRLDKQLKYMEAHPECALLGTRAEIWVGDQRTERAHDHPSSHADLCFDLLFNNPFVHSSVMLRRNMLEEIGGYTTDPSRQPPEDYELWSRIARRFKIANIPERLLIYREVSQSMSRSGPNPFQNKLVNICAENLAFATNFDKQDDTILDIAALTHSAFDRISKNPNITRMCTAIITAGNNIADEFDCPKIKGRALERAKVLHHQFLSYRTHPKWTLPLIRLTRTVMRKLLYDDQSFKIKES